MQDDVEYVEDHRTGHSAHPFSFLGKSPDAADCQALCRETPKCVAYTWNSPEAKQPDFKCYGREDGYYVAMPAPGRFSGHHDSVVPPPLHQSRRRDPDLRAIISTNGNGSTVLVFGRFFQDAMRPVADVEVRFSMAVPPGGTSCTVTVEQVTAGIDPRNATVPSQVSKGRVAVLPDGMLAVTLAAVPLHDGFRVIVSDCV